MNIKTLRIDEIVIDDKILLRPLNEKKAAEYADAMRHRRSFPEIDVFYDGKVYRLADGQHRIRGTVLARREGEMDQRETIDAYIHEGGFKAALIFACGANATHGMPRKNAEKVEAVRRLFVVAELVAESNRKIARLAGVSHQMAVDMRKKLEKAGVIEPQKRVRVQAKDGKSYERPARQRLSTVDNHPQVPEKPSLTPEQKRDAEHVRQSLEKEGWPTKKRKPRLSAADRRQRDMTFAFIEDNQTSPVPGDEAIRRWDAYEWLDKFKRTRQWLNEAIAECERGKQEDVA